jgi:hypothetical protein
MEIEKKWSLLLSIMTEDENGRVRAGDEKELMGLWIEEFFTKLLVFRERLDEKIEQMKKQNKDANNRI